MTVSHIVGIDPGLSGAIALVTRDGELFDVTDMPTRKTVTATGKKAIEDLFARSLEGEHADASEAHSSV